jgi:branched-chain amino acid transport system permease protein
VLGAITLTFINFWLIPDVLNTLPGKLGLDFDMTQITFAIYGFLLVIMMIMRPQGLLPERRRAEEMTHGEETSAETLYTARA